MRGDILVPYPCAASSKNSNDIGLREKNLDNKTYILYIYINIYIENFLIIIKPTYLIKLTKLISDDIVIQHVYYVQHNWSKYIYLLFMLNKLAISQQIWRSFEFSFLWEMNHHQYKQFVYIMRGKDFTYIHIIFNTWMTAYIIQLNAVLATMWSVMVTNIHLICTLHQQTINSLNTHLTDHGENYWYLLCN